MGMIMNREDEADPIQGFYTHVPRHVPFVAGRNRSADEGAARMNAACLDPNDDEYL
jgi:hypothetical protein